MKKILIIIAVLVVIVIGVSLISSNSTPGDQTADVNNGETIAIVNGEEVTQANLLAFQNQIAAQQGFDLADLSEEEQAQLQTQALDSLVSQTLLRQAVEQSGVGASGADIDSQIETIKGQFPSEEEFDQAILAEGLTEEVLRSQINDELAVQAYLDQELDFSSLTATEEEVNEAYEQVTAQGEAPPLDEIYAQVEEMVLQQKQQELIAGHLEELRAEAEVEVLI